MRTLLYPQALGGNNMFLVARSKEEIVQVVKLLKETIVGKSQSNNGKDRILSPQPNLPNSSQSPYMRSSQHQQLNASPNRMEPSINEARQLSSLLQEENRSIGLTILKSKDKEFNSLMNLLYIKYKNSPVSFT